MTSWILDSGASRHMTGRKDFLFNVVSISSVPITLPNGSTTTTSCEGSVFLSSIFFLQNVLYVPNLICHLVSLPQLIRQNPSYYVGIADGLCVI